ncbi:MAG: hydrogenase small subunit [Chloroflexota bacterium]
MADDGLYAALMRRGMSRRSFLQFTTAMAAALALPASYAPRIARAVEGAPRLPVIWLRGQDCAGETEAFLRAPEPSAASLLLDVLSMEYHESLMAPAGAAAELSLTTALERSAGGYLVVVEGAIPTGAGGAFCLVGGRPFADVVREVADGALATIAVGACAFDGGVPGAGGGVTNAASLREVVGGHTIALPGCPLNVENLVATIVHYLTFEEWPARDMMGRPLFAYGPLIHNECERRPHFEFGEFVQAWGDEGAQKGWCLYKVGCKGPETFGNCASVRFGEGTSWPVRAGHGCIGCTMPDFWDAMSPFYLRLPSPVPPFPNLTVDMVGAGLVAGVGGLAVVHGMGMYVTQRRRRAAARREVAARAGEGAVAVEPPVAVAAEVVAAPVAADLTEAAEPAEAVEVTGPAAITREPEAAEPAEPAEAVEVTGPAVITPVPEAPEPEAPEPPPAPAGDRPEVR